MQFVSLCENAALTWSTINTYILYAVYVPKKQLNISPYACE